LASYSAMERSVEGNRVKSFDADELFSLARMFGVRTWQLLIPPINFRLNPVRIRPKGAPSDKSLARDAAMSLIVEIPEDNFAGFTSRLAGQKPRSERREAPPTALDMAVWNFFVQRLSEPRPSSALEEQKQYEETVSFLKEINEARQKRSELSREGLTLKKSKRRRRKLR